MAPVTSLGPTTLTLSNEALVPPHILLSRKPKSHPEASHPKVVQVSCVFKGSQASTVALLVPQPNGPASPPHMVHCIAGPWDALPKQ